MRPTLRSWRQPSNASPELPDALGLEDFEATDRNRADPSPREIRRQCLEIQKGWSETTRRHRAGAGEPRRWSVPFASAPEFAGQFLGN